MLTAGAVRSNFAIFRSQFAANSGAQKLGAPPLGDDVIVLGRQRSANIAEAKLDKPTLQLIEIVQIIDRRTCCIEPAVNLFRWELAFEVGHLFIEIHERGFRAVIAYRC